MNQIGEVVAKQPITKAQVEQVVKGIIQLGKHNAEAIAFLKPVENSEGPYPVGRYPVSLSGQTAFVDLTPPKTQKNTITKAELDHLLEKSIARMCAPIPPKADGSAYTEAEAVAISLAEEEQWLQDYRAAQQVKK